MALFCHSSETDDFGLYWMGILHKNAQFIDLKVGYLALFCHFSVVDSFGLLWKGSLLKNIQLLLAFNEAQFFVLLFSYYTLMALPMILYVILLSTLIKLLFTLSIIGLLICYNQ